MRARLLILMGMMGFLLADVGRAAELAVIVHRSNKDQLSLNDVKRIYLGKKKKFASVGRIKPADFTKGTQLRATFYEKVTGRSAKAVDTYWYRLVFTGKGVPPKSFSGSDGVLDYVASNEGAIGYVEAARVKGNVRIVLKIK